MIAERMSLSAKLRIYRTKQVDMKTAIYCRVSTDEQTVEPQLIELRAYAAQRKMLVTHEFTDTISGSKYARTGLDALLELVRAKKVEAVLVVKIDRVSRSLKHFVRFCDELKQNGVSLIVPGQGIDTSSQNPCGEMQLGILAVIAQFERSLIRERTRAGLAAARACGKKLGRPSLKLVSKDLWIAIIGQWKVDTGGKDFDDLGCRLGGVSRATAWRIYKRTIIASPVMMEVD